jgi:small GTP-binding protein
MNLSITQNNNLSQSNNYNLISYNKGNISYLNESKFSNNQKDISVERTIYQFTVILVGDLSVGKTSLIKRFMGEDFNVACQPTISTEFKVRSILLNPNEGAELKIWDTCGQEKFRSLTRQYFRQANGIILVYDCSDRKTFLNLEQWIKEIKENSPPNCSLILVGNKVDLPRNVSNQEGMDFSEKHKIKYVEVSAKDGINIELPFENISNEIIENSKRIEENIEENNEPNEFPFFTQNSNQNLKELSRPSKVKPERRKEASCC